MIQNMKTLLRSFIFIVLLGSLSAQNVSKVGKSTISKVKVYLDNEELTSENEDSASFKLSTILSYTKLKAGKSFSSSALDKEITQTELRLINSGLFYTAKVEKMASRKNPGTYIIYITVTTGFLKRYGGGGIYAIIGDAGIDGKRQQVLWFAGLNRNGVSYLNENCFKTPLIFGSDLFTNIPDNFVDKKEALISGKITIGSFITPDLRICIDTAATFNISNKKFEKNFAISPYLSATHFTSEKCFWTSELRFNYFPIASTNNYFDSAFTVNYTPVKQITLAGMACGGYSPQNQSNNISLYRSSDTLSYNLGLSNREIRSGYSKEDLSVRGYLMATGELRWNALSFTVPPCFPAHMVPYIFTDIAAVEKIDTNGTSSNGIMDAYGAGVYLVFDCPVFATFNFSYGVNQNGKWRFSFAAMQSF